MFTSFLKHLVGLIILLYSSSFVYSEDVVEKWKSEGYVVVPLFEMDSFIQLLKVKGRETEYKYLQWCYEQWIKDNPSQYCPWYPHYYRYICDILHIKDVRSDIK